MEQRDPNVYPSYRPAPPPQKKGMPVWGWILIAVGGLGCLAIAGIAVVAALGIFIARTNNTISPVIQEAIPLATIFQSDDDQTSATDVPSSGDHTNATQIAPATNVDVEADPLVVADLWYASDAYTATQIYYAFVVENPNKDVAIQNAQFQTVAYDASGTILGTSEDSVYMIMPGEKFGVSGNYGMSIPENSTVAEIKVSLLYPGDTVQLDLGSGDFSVDKVTYFSDEYSRKATLIVQNSYNFDVFNPVVSAIVYDKDGKIIGSGAGYDLYYLPAGGSSPATISLTVDGEVDRIDVYVGLSYDFEYERETYKNLPTVVDQGFGEPDEWGYTTYGAVIQNPADGKALQYLYYMVDFYDASGVVLAVGSGSVSSIFPGETQGITGTAQIPTGYTVDHVEIRMSPPDTSYDSMGLEEAGITSNPLATENVTLMVEEYDAKVTGVITNSWDQAVSADLIILAYDADGKIIGGAYGYATTVPANGSAAIEVYLYLAEDPASVVVYPSLYSLDTY